MDYFENAKCRVVLGGYSIEYSVDDFSRRELRLHSIDIHGKGVKISIYYRDGSTNYTVTINGYSARIRSIRALLEKYVVSDKVIDYIEDILGNSVKGETVDGCVARVYDLAGVYGGVLDWLSSDPRN